MSQIPDHYNDVGPGWRKILAGLDGKLLMVDPDYEVAQVKEKFGGLRCYLNFIDKGDAVVEECNRLVAEAELACEKTCEGCGKPAPGARIVPGGAMWMKTFCDDCGTHMHDFYESGDVPEEG